MRSNTAGASSFVNSVFSLAPTVNKTFLQSDQKDNVAISKRFSMIYNSSSKIAKEPFEDGRSTKSKNLTKFEKAQ